MPITKTAIVNYEFIYHETELGLSVLLLLHLCSRSIRMRMHTTIMIFVNREYIIYKLISCICTYAYYIYEYHTPQIGDMLMDAPATETWKELCDTMHIRYSMYVWDREYWRVRVRSLRQSRVTTVTLGPHRENEMTVPFTIST